MTGSSAAGLVRAWVNLYTRGLPAELRTARRDEVADDLWCEQEEAATVGRSAGGLATDRFLRMLFGMPADVGWRLTYRGTPPPVPERSGSMTTRTPGTMAIGGGLIFAVLLLMFIPFSHGLWEGTFGALPLLATFVGVAAFGATAFGLVARFQDQLGPLGVIGAVVVAVGALLSMGASIVPLLVGLVLLTSALARIGVTSWLVPIANLISALAGVVLTVSQPNLDNAGVRALYVGLMAPFFLGWIWMGVSLVRRGPLAPAATA